MSNSIGKKKPSFNDSGNLQFDPDELVLSKQDVMDIMDALIQRWKKNFKANYQLIGGMYAIKGAMSMTPEDTVKGIWRSIIVGFNALMYENAISKAKSQNEAWGLLFDRVKTRIKNGELDIDGT